MSVPFAQSYRILGLGFDATSWQIKEAIIQQGYMRQAGKGSERANLVYELWLSKWVDESVRATNQAHDLIEPQVPRAGPFTLLTNFLGNLIDSINPINQLRYLD